MIYILTIVIFHRYVRLPEGMWKIVEGQDALWFSAARCFWTHLFLEPLGAHDLIVENWEGKS